MYFVSISPVDGIWGFQSGTNDAGKNLKMSFAGTDLIHLLIRQIQTPPLGTKRAHVPPHLEKESPLLILKNLLGKYCERESILFADEILVIVFDCPVT